MPTWSPARAHCTGWMRKRKARGVERRLRPAALRDAELVHVEETFRTTNPVPIAAKLDRAYRLPSGKLVLVELKTRWNGGPNFSDVIQLSAQRVALSAATGQTVASEAFVLIARPGARRWLLHTESICCPPIRSSRWFVAGTPFSRTGSRRGTRRRWATTEVALSEANAPVLAGNGAYRPSGDAADVGDPRHQLWGGWATWCRHFGKVALA